MITIETAIKIILVTVVLCFISVLVIKRFLYFRPTYDILTPRENFEDINEGDIHAWFLRNNNSRKVVLFCHGNAGNLSYRQDKLIALHSLGYSVLIFDYRGFGRSKGVPTEEACYHTANMFTDILIKEYGKENIVLYGESLGSAVAAYVALRYNISTLIIESGISSIKSVIKAKSRIIGLFSFVFYEFDTHSYLEHYKGRTLVLHCKNDEIVSWDSTESIRELATKVIEMNGSHNNATIPWDEIKSFIN